VPDTIISNDQGEINHFVQNHPDHIVKPLYHGDTFVPLGNGMIYQQRVDKKADIRLTVVDGRLFPCRITSGLNDWRQDEHAAYEPVSAPREIVKSVYRYMQHFRLYYGAFDFAVSKAGPWYFLECNPNGQFGWLERKTGLAISKAIADLLAEQPDILVDRRSPVGMHRRSSGQS
jgi:glutathione synthase/RimK-type ligase-like ATP-grasp enzyme